MGKRYRLKANQKQVYPQRRYFTRTACIMRIHIYFYIDVRVSVCEQISISVWCDFGPGDDVNDVASERHVRETLTTLYVYVYIKDYIQGAIAISVQSRESDLLCMKTSRKCRINLFTNFAKLTTALSQISRGKILGPSILFILLS